MVTPSDLVCRPYKVSRWVLLSVLVGIIDAFLYVQFVAFAVHRQ